MRPDTVLGNASCFAFSCPFACFLTTLWTIQCDVSLLIFSLSRTRGEGNYGKNTLNFHIYFLDAYRIRSWTLKTSSLLEKEVLQLLTSDMHILKPFMERPILVFLWFSLRLSATPVFYVFQIWPVVLQVSLSRFNKIMTEI